MLNFGHLTSAVQANCDISDAKYAGNYSLCTFLLKMREYYRWENDIPLAAPLAKDDIGQWLSMREQHWDTLNEAELRLLPLGAELFDPFDTDRINAYLIPQGAIYSGGRGLFSKPQFFLGELRQTFVEDNVSFFVSGCEFAREISASPAMALGESVFIRQESLRRFLWEKIEEWRWKKNENAPLARSLACYPDPDNVENTLEHMTENETHTLMYHELGEVQAGRRIGAAWHEMLASLKRTKAEFLARAARDNFADCLITIPNLVKQDNIPALHFYFANFTGLRREMFPEAQAAYLRWIGGAGKHVLIDMCAQGVANWGGMLERMVQSFSDAPENIDTAIESMLGQTPGETLSCSR